MEFLVFTDNPSTGETRLVLEELRGRGHRVEYLAPWDVLLPGFQPQMDAAYVPSNMLHRGTTFELVHRLLVLRRLEEEAPVVNPVDSMLVYSKEHLTLTLHRLGIPHPETLVTENLEEARGFAERLLGEGREVVLKPVCRARGLGVVKLSGIRSPGDLTQFLHWYSRAWGGGVFYLQEFVENRGFDVRLLVVGGEVVGREARSNPSDFRYNVAVGGEASPFTSPEFDELALKVAEALGLAITGIDVLPSSQGDPVVLEANCYPGYHALMKATGAPVPQRIADYLERVARR